MRTYRIPLLLWFFLAFLMAILPAAIFAYPVGGLIYIAVYFFGGGPGAEASELSKMFAQALCTPGILFDLFLKRPNVGGDLNLTMMIYGFPHAWIIFTIILSLLGFTRLNRKFAESPNPAV